MVFRFDIKTANQYVEWSDILAVWREADGIEVFHTAWLFDHFYPIWSPSRPQPDPSEPCLEGWTMLAALAQTTTRLRMGTMVTGICYRNPGVLANMVATLDIISAGRLDLGIGAGWNEQESGAYGIELGTMTQRMDRFDEACQILVSLLSNTTTDFAGDYYTFTNAYCEPKGPQQPHPPILIGGGGEKRTMRTAAKYAQHWNMPLATPAEFTHKLGVLHAHCADLGRDPGEITASAHIWLTSNTADGIARLVDEVAAFRDAGATAAIIYLPTPLDPAVLTPLAEQLTALT